MKNLVCPTSPLRINENVARMTGFMMATMMALYAFTGSIALIMVIVLDYFVRAFTTLKYSPASWLASGIVQHLRLPEVPIDKAPKIFAARVGFLFAAAALGLFSIEHRISVTVGLILMGFALLESVFNVCVGCVVYTYLVLPIFHRRKGMDSELPQDLERSLRKE